MKIGLHFVPFIIEQMGEFAFVPFGIWYSSSLREWMIQPCPFVRITVKLRPE